MQGHLSGPSACNSIVRFFTLSCPALTAFHLEHLPDSRLAARQDCELPGTAMLKAQQQVLTKGPRPPERLKHCWEKLHTWDQIVQAVPRASYQNGWDVKEENPPMP